ncbi:MAG TPA: hypothetical protein VF829_03390 [Candidatus Paceibacterota bacterium]
MKYGELTLGQIEALVNKLGGMGGVRRILAGAEVVIKGLLSLVTTITAPAIESFVAANKFREGETIDGVKIGGIGDNFKKHLLGKIEKKVSEAVLRIQNLEEASVDGPILEELGDTAETTLAHLWEVLKRGKKAWYIAYIRDDNGELWAVGANWDVDRVYWNVGAVPVTNPNRWNAGDQVVSR